MILSDYEAVVIGVSAGGLNALGSILPQLPADFPLAVIIVLHLHPSSDLFLITHFAKLCSLPVYEADEKEEILPGTIYFAAPNYHLLVERDKTFALSVDQRVRFARPSIDVLFETAARAYSHRLIGIILTGANDDGATGLAMIKKEGGLAIVQNPETAEVETMPEAAIEACSVDYILDLPDIAQLLCGKLTNKKTKSNRIQEP